MATFSGQLRSNEIFAALYNMIISQQVFADNIKGDDLVSSAKVDGGLYGDTKLYYSTDVLASSEWGNDAEATNLLQIHRPKAPECQTITLDTFRQISLTVDNYLSKRAWGDEGSFSSFNSVMKGWVTDTKKVYEGTTFNAYMGTAEGASNTATVEIPLSDITATGEEKNRLEAQTIARKIAQVVRHMCDYTRDFNDYKQLRRYSKSEVKILWNEDWVDKITLLDIPTIYNNSGLFTDMSNTLPAKYFGTVNAEEKESAGTTTHSLVEQDIGSNHYFAGDVIKSGDTAPAGTSYEEDEDVICKIYVKLPPFMSAFEVGTSFFNPKSLTENQYLTWGHNTIEYLKNYPLVTVHAD